MTTANGVSGRFSIAANSKPADSAFSRVRQATGSGHRKIIPPIFSLKPSSMRQKDLYERALIGLSLFTAFAMTLYACVPK